MAILYPTSLANLVVEVGTRHCHQTLLKWKKTVHHWSLISMLDIVQSCDCDFAFKTQTANFPSTKSRPQSSSRPSQILLTVCLFQEIFLAYFCWSSKHALAVILMHLAVRIMIGLLTRRRLFLDRLPACRKERTWCWNISVVVNNHVTSKQVHDRTINEIISFIWRILWPFLYNRIIVYVQIEAYLSTTVKLFVLVAFVMGDISTWSSVTLVSRSPFLLKIPYSFHLINISKTPQLLYQISPNQPTLVGPHLTEKRLMMWVLYVTLTRVQTSHWWLELLCSETCN